MRADGGLRSLFRRHLPLVDFVSVEMHRGGRGVPDVNYCVAGCEGWIEMKRISGWRARVSPEQVGWAERRIRAGGRVLVAIRRRDEMAMFSGLQLRVLRKHDVRDVHPVGEWSGGPSGWNWEEILAIMMCHPATHGA